MQIKELNPEEKLKQLPNEVLEFLLEVLKREEQRHQHESINQNPDD